MPVLKFGLSRRYQVRAIDRIDRIRQAKRAELDQYQESLDQVRDEENKCKREFTQLLMSVWEEAQISAENMERYKAELNATKELLSESITAGDSLSLRTSNTLKVTAIPTADISSVKWTAFHLRPLKMRMGMKMTTSKQNEN